MDFRIAKVQYGDYHGEAAIDGYGAGTISELVKTFGVPETHFPVGLSIFCEEHAAQDGKVSVHAAAIPIDKYGDSVDRITRNAEDGVLHAEIFNCGEHGFKELFKYIKRFKITAVNSSFDDLQIECPDGSL